MPESSPASPATWYPVRRMSYSRALSATLLSAALSFSLVTASGCGTAAIGIDDCRDIEQARCQASAKCGMISDVKSCQRYYRDHCLHGLPVKPPAGDSVSSCVEVIKAAGRCADGDPSVELSACDPFVADAKQGFTRACDVVANPERTPQCAFLSDLPEEEDTGAAGAAGQGGATAE